MAIASVGLDAWLSLSTQCSSVKSQISLYSSMQAYKYVPKKLSLSPPSLNAVCRYKRTELLELPSILRSRKSCMTAAALDPEDEWGEAADSGGKLTAAVEESTEAENAVESLKMSLLDSFYGTERGLRASSETRGEIVELITQLESKNPTPAPTEALSLLNGKWILQYTSFSELFPLLAAGVLPLVKVGEISQIIDSDALTVQNSVSFIGPLATTSFSALANFEVRSAKRVQIKFEEGAVSTPQLTDSIEIPENLEVLGQKIDLAPLQGILRPLQDAALSVAKTISGQPPLKFRIRMEKAQSWLLTTFLDKDLRISRGDGGSVFILVKEGSTLLSL